MSAMPNIVPISELRQDASSIVREAAATGDPVFITQHGRASAVLLSAGAYERTQRELEILRILAQGEADIQAGVGYDIDVVMAEADALLEQR
ncbi:MAG: type II toxin-antitoxin system Phd/YefM family antitoxin [Coriobacteriia bacterium]|nr:type II toxin-antitoxin system Phd/YefM family antitoxin [Actinomycetota bacterium]MDZ4166912.1 type II toxin-antitoxin system Phd/YefM family antitoxin [Coriobacteriia bacterium]